MVNLYILLININIITDYVYFNKERHILNNKVLRIIIIVMLVAIVAALLLTSLVPLMH